jgi:hypothetical protein
MCTTKPSLDKVSHVLIFTYNNKYFIITHTLILNRLYNTNYNLIIKQAFKKYNILISQYFIN